MIPEAPLVAEWAASSLFKRRNQNSTGHRVDEISICGAQDSKSSSPIRQALSSSRLVFMLPAQHLECTEIVSATHGHMLR